MDQNVLAYIIETLDDDQGISKSAYDALTSLLHGQDKRLDEVIDQIKSVDGRFYLPIDAPCLEYRYTE